MEGRIMSESVSRNTEVLYVQFSDEPDTRCMTPEEHEFYEHDLLWEVFMDHHVVKDDVIDAMRSAGFDRDDLLSCDDIPRML